VTPNIDLWREQWEEDFLEDFPEATEREIQEAWESERDAKFADPEDVLEPDGSPRDADFAYDDEAAAWEHEVPPEAEATSQEQDEWAAETRIFKRAHELEAAGVPPREAVLAARAELERREREARHQAAAGDAPTDARTWNRRLMNEQGPALDVGKSRGPAPKAPPERGFEWESEEQPPPYAVEADAAGIDAQSPVTYYAERARDDFDSTRSMPYLCKTAEGTQEWREIGGAVALIREVLSAVRPLDEWQIALRRGRRSAEASAIREELAVLIARLVDVQGAQAKAVAKALERGRDAVHALLREGRAKSDT
jgi:hypothetical protein